jgi:hypothetical protein
MFIEGSFGSDMTGDDSSAMLAITTAPPLAFQHGKLSSFGFQQLAPTIAKTRDRRAIERIMVWRSVRYWLLLLHCRPEWFSVNMFP